MAAGAGCEHQPIGEKSRPANAAHGHMVPAKGFYAVGGDTRKVLRDRFAQVMDLLAEAADFVRCNGAGPQPQQGFLDLVH